MGGKNGKNFKRKIIINLIVLRNFLTFILIKFLRNKNKLLINTQKEQEEKNLLHVLQVKF